MSRRWVLRGRGGIALALAAAAGGCTTVPAGQFGVAQIRFRGNQAIGDSALKKRLATTETPKLLGLVRLPWVPYELYDPIVFDRDLQRVEHVYRRSGYLEAKVRAARIRLDGRLVHAEIVVDEGTPVRVRSVAIEGLEALPENLARAVRSAVTIQVGGRFDEEDLASSVSAMREALQDRGRAYAQVESAAVIDLGPHAADLRFEVRPGIPSVFGPVTIEGLGGLPEGLVRRTLDLAPGTPYQTSELGAARAALQALPAIASAQVVPDLGDETRADVPIRVSILPSATAGFKLGAGVLVDFTRADVHGVFGWEHRNFLGGMRHLLLEERPALVLFPTAVPQLLPPSRLLPANQASLVFRQPAFFEARTLGTVQVEQSIYPVIVPPLNPDAEIILGYREARAAVGPERTFTSLHLLGSLLYDVQASFPFTYVGPLDPELSPIVASYVDLRTQFDLRDDLLSPHEGFLLSNDLQLAGGVLGGDADDVRVKPEIRLYLPFGRGVTLATRTTVGLLFPRTYGRTLTDPVPSVHDVQLLYFRGFFSGGADSNRGYGYREIGPHGVAPFLVPGSVEAARQRCQPGSPTYDQRLCSVALGGRSLWEASVELRALLHGDLSGVLFLDASDVSPRQVDVRLDVPHLSAGFGVRYATPIGPVRADVGVRIPGAQRIGGTLDPLTEGTPGLLFGLPAAISLGLGESF